MASSYISFLQSPTTSALAPNASLHYVTTTTSIHEATAIVKHLQAQDKVVKKKSESILSSFASPDGAVFETDTAFEFVRGGGAILPQMDDNMLADSLASIPMVHVVQFDGQGKIAQIRMYWDQASLLKQVEAIGRSGRNWPIRDGIAQVRTIKQSVNAASSGSTSMPSRPANANDNDVVVTDRSRQPRASVDFQSRFFGSGDDTEHRSHSSGPAVAPRTSARPPSRQPEELFTTEPSVLSPPPEAKHRAGAGKNFGSNRLFDENAPAARDLSPERKKVNSQKYNHFELGHGEDAPSPDPNRPLSSKAKKHMTNWDFDTFNTPEKVKPRANPGQERHIGPGLDEDQPSPAKRPIVHAPRPDADAHFKMVDKNSPGQGPKAPLGSITNTDRSRRADDTDPHFRIKDSPSQPDTVPASRARGDLEPHFQIGDLGVPKKIYKTAGNGMGGRKGAPTLWDEPEPVKQQAIYKTYGNGMGGRRDGGLSWSIGDKVEDENKEPAIYKTRGDGMGGRRDLDASSGARADEYEF